jgi:ribonuclease III
VPVYTVLGTRGPAHKRTFSVQVEIHGTVSVGHGKNKKEAEQTAAKNALSVLV